MKHTICSSKTDTSLNIFPKIDTVQDLHNLEGSLWLYNGDKHVNMFCQVGNAQFSMIELDTGNRNISAFHHASEVRDALDLCVPFKGTVTIVTI